ncbi:hypothetical protein AKJ18_22055 [Vibrio xuii]|jgi:hypothetical protein|nr:hypothetical protein AKJ18_22055 [Vibrio xuii]
MSQEWAALAAESATDGRRTALNNLTKFRRQLGKAQTNANILSMYASILLGLLELIGSIT